MICPHCHSGKVKKAGTFNLRSGLVKQRFSCGDCSKSFSKDETNNKRFEFTKTMKAGRYVITSAQNNVEVNQPFLETLEGYCKKNNAELIVLPIFVNKRLYPGDLLNFGDLDEKYIIPEKFCIDDKINVLSNINISPHADNPLAGLENLSKGKTLIVPHTQVQMKSLPVSADMYPTIITTTGTITVGDYREGKAGQKASFNHSYGALIVDFDGDQFHIRHLNCDDDNGFFDIDGYYLGDKFTKLQEVEAIVFGDEHVYSIDEYVARANYDMTMTLRPKQLIRHDILDSFTISHHHKKNTFLQYYKHTAKKNRIEEELDQTFVYMLQTTPDFSQSIVVSSNHHDHLGRWLNECDPKIEPWNAKLYHRMTFMIMEEIDTKGSIPDAFQMYFEEIFDFRKVARGMNLIVGEEKKLREKVRFLGRNESYKIAGIELSNHGDIGANGSRGSLTQYAKFNDKNVIGHSHTPGIQKGAYQVGTSTSKKLEYTNGPSSWMNTHCVIYPNGKRQLINIINGKWRKL